MSRPFNPDLSALLERALALHQAGRLDEAERLYLRIVNAQPRHGDALALLGAVHMQRENFEEALRLLDASLAINRRQPAALNNRGIALRGLKRYDEALASYARALVLRPNYAEAYNNRGVALADLNRHDEALRCYDRALALNPYYADAHYNRGASLHDLRRVEEALASYDKALALAPGFAAAHASRANDLRDLGRYDEALASYDRALALAPDDAAALYGRGEVLRNLGRYEEALASYDRALALAPDDAAALYSRAEVLRNLGRYEEALASYARARALDPDREYLLGYLVYTKMMLCEWDGIGLDFRELQDKIDAGAPAATPMALLTMPSTPSQQRRCAEIFVRRFTAGSVAPLWTGERYSHERIRLAYFSADYYSHATSYLMAELFERHDRSKFELYGFSFGPRTQDEMRRRVEKAFDRFLDVRDRSSAEIAQLARRLEIDIAVDLKGYTTDARPEIFAMRPAPIQVNYLGTPGTLGAGYMDYLIADSIVIPPEHRAHYVEHVAYLPHSYYPTATPKASDAVPNRQACGLPEKGLVFCCFNSNHKILPDVFEVWMRLLKAVPGSVLWLLEGYPGAAKNLRREAAARGVSAERIVFAGKAASGDHLARHLLADLFLDTLPYNAHTTACDALWMGVPVLTCLGGTFAGRVAASLLYAISLDTLVTHSLEEYEALALTLATSPEKLAEIRQLLTRNRSTHPLFDTGLFARHMEDAYVEMRQRREAGLSPEDFYVKERQKK